MLKHILASSALAALITSGAYAQTTEPNTTEPVTEGMPSGEGMAPAGDETVTPPEVLGEGATVPPDSDAATTGMDPVDPAADPAIDPAADPMADPMTDTAMESDYQPVDISTVSSENLIGTDIVNANDETIASIEDVIITDDGQVESIVAKFGGFLGFGSESVVLTMDDVEIMATSQDSENLVVRTSLTPEQIEAMPPYEG
jgi:hypothetical protein